jgi:Na+-translocating ferredoxin:NAD+ oxidoreductase subunit G
MNEMIKMVVVLTVLAALSGGLLAAVRSGTSEQIESQQLQFVKGPAIKEILSGASNDPISDRFNLMVGESEATFFVGKFNDKAHTVAFEGTGRGGYGGDIGVMVGVNVETDNIIGVAVTTHSETPGLGAKAKTDPKFTAQFEGLPVTKPSNSPKAAGRSTPFPAPPSPPGRWSAALRAPWSDIRKLKPQIMEEIKAFR